MDTGILDAFAAGSLIAALAIELAFEGAQDLARHGANVHAAWAEIAGGFAVGAVAYCLASLFLESKGAALRYPSRFLEYALKRKRAQASETVGLLAQCDLLRHLPAERIEQVIQNSRGNCWRLLPNMSNRWIRMLRGKLGKISRKGLNALEILNAPNLWHLFKPLPF